MSLRTDGVFADTDTTFWSFFGSAFLGRSSSSDEDESEEESDEDEDELEELELDVSGIFGKSDRSKKPLTDVSTVELPDSTPLH